MSGCLSWGAKDAPFKKHTVAPCCSRPEQEDLLMMSACACTVAGVECGGMAKEAETRTSTASSKQYIS